MLFRSNPTAGIFEFIPDVIPGLGNLDEGLALLLIWAGVVEYFEGSKAPSKETGTAAPGTADDSTAKEAAPAGGKEDEDVVDGKWEEDSSS